MTFYTSPERKRIILDKWVSRGGSKNKCVDGIIRNIFNDGLCYVRIFQQHILAWYLYNHTPKANLQV